MTRRVALQGAVAVAVASRWGGGAVDELAHRRGTLEIRTRPGARVEVTQLRHDFWFGATLASGQFPAGELSPEQRRYREIFLTHFNAAVTENAVKWPSMEPRRGQVDYRVVDAMLAFCDEHGLPLRGHCLFWGIPNRVQDWVKALGDDELRQVLRERATTMGRRYAGRFAEYDLNNEMLHGNYYADRLGPGITKDMFGWVQEADPTAKLFVNDYDILTGRLVDRYVEQIRGFLEQGIPVAGIGVQGHLHGDTFDPVALRESLDKLAVFGLPIRVTEFNFPGQRSKFYRDPKLTLTAAEEEAKARAIVDYYRICFAHPAVAGILQWGFWRRACWIPASAMFDEQFRPLPAAEAYRELIYRDWWTSLTLTADAAGRCAAPAWFGRHKVTANDRTVELELTRAAGRAEVNLT